MLNKAKNFVKEEFVNNFFSKSLDEKDKAIQLNWFNLLRQSKIIFYMIITILSLYLII